MIIEHLGKLSLFGVSLSASACQQIARHFVLLLYGQKGKKCNNMDEQRYTLPHKEAAILPPTENAFKQHLLRALLQTSLWCQK